ncbi:hypothetical protein B0J15DRAFT_462341 [Fusarium solani]|uniref:2EXR domain-containing protein n=1 Tax=Fusarium solani TaxID=169388 RepID=A0A9P9KTP3_FUSSL|nr:uncharacterized protein B0J15DRAFT_462341 [Fusarium solani]KAH7268316.1 hypothetical protein B0J15DRAFT_462341 [Fusarium solani]
MDDTFHYFIKLPWELRDQIWKLVIRLPLPGVHIFQIYDPKYDNVIGNNIEVFLPHGCPDDHRLAIPRSKNSFASVTLLDRGLWSACKESRLVMKRHFSRLKWQTLMDEDWGSFWSMPFEKKLNMPLTGHFIGLDGHTNFFTVFPHRDLFMLQPLNLDTIDWFNFTTRHPLASAMNGFETVKNIALEYDPEWGLDMIDKDVAFYLEDRRLVEVDPWMTRSEWKTIENDAECSESTTFKDSVDFMEHIWDQIGDDEELEWHQWIEAPRRVGLLGCDCL